MPYPPPPADPPPARPRPPHPRPRPPPPPPTPPLTARPAPPVPPPPPSPAPAPRPPTPPQLLTQRIKARLAQAGVKVLTSTDVGSGAPMLRLELDDFAQNFSSATLSSGDLAVRASLFRNHRLVDQRTFRRSSPAPSADAAGGARALADASDALAADLLAWLATLPPQ